jgi:hypothetical protein
MTRVLHVLDHSLLPGGYTFRTRDPQGPAGARDRGVRAITRQRHRLPDGPRVAVGGAPEQIDGLEFHRTPGEAEGIVGSARMRNEVVAPGQPDRSGGPRVAAGRAARPFAGAVRPCAVRAGRRLGIPVVCLKSAFWEDAAVGNGTGREGSPRYWLTPA